MCEAFQATVAARKDEVALRTRGGADEMTWGEYDARVRHAAAALHRLGLRRGDTLALMLANRPEFHIADAAAMHLGAIPFSIYNTSAPEQVEFVRPGLRRADRGRRGATSPSSSTPST